MKLQVTFTVDVQDDLAADLPYGEGYMGVVDKIRFTDGRITIDQTSDITVEPCESLPETCR